MAYTKNPTWQPFAAGGTLVTAAKLNHIEDGIFDAAADSDAALATKITAFADPNADRIVFWDDSAGAFVALAVSSPLNITGTTFSILAASTTVAGVSEILTDTEFDTGTDTSRFATAIQLRQLGRTFRAANAAAVTTAKSRAIEGDLCYQADTGDTWRKTGADWKLWHRPKTSWPTITFSSGFTMGNATHAGEYWVNDGFLDGSFLVTAGTTSAFAAGGIVMQLPLATEALTVPWHVGTTGRLTDGANVYPMWMLIPTTSNDLFLRLDDHATALGNIINSTLVYAAGAATGKSMQASIRYPTNVTV